MHSECTELRPERRLSYVPNEYHMRVEALAALGGARLLNPLSVERVQEILSTAGARNIAFSHCGPGLHLVVATSPP